MLKNLIPICLLLSCQADLEPYSDTESGTESSTSAGSSTTSTSDGPSSGPTGGSSSTSGAATASASSDGGSSSGGVSGSSGSSSGSGSSGAGDYPGLYESCDPFKAASGEQPCNPNYPEPLTCSLKRVDNEWVAMCAIFEDLEGDGGDPGDLCGPSGTDDQNPVMPSSCLNSFCLVCDALGPGVSCCTPFCEPDAPECPVGMLCSGSMLQDPPNIVDAGWCYYE